MDNATDSTVVSATILERNMRTSSQIAPREIAPQTDSPRRAQFIHSKPKSDAHIELGQADW